MHIHEDGIEVADSLEEELEARGRISLSLAPIVCSELWPVHRNTKIDKSLRLQVGVPGWLRTGHSSGHIIIGARDKCFQGNRVSVEICSGTTQ